MDAQHQKTNKSAQFACYLRTYIIIEYYILHLSFRAAVSPPQSICSPTYTANSSRTTRQASKQQREGEVFGDDFFLLFFGHGDKRLRQELPTLPTSLQTGEPRTVNCELRLGNQTTMCDYTKVEYACYHLRYTVRAWCKSTYFSDHLFLFFFFFLSSSFLLSFCTYFSMSAARLTLLICVFLGVKYQETHKVPTSP